MEYAVPLSIVIAYLLGSIPTGYLLTRRARGVDIREVGDRYSGAKNVFREVGRVAGALTALGDVAKGALAIVLARWLMVPDWALVLVALAVVLGHNWPVWLGFRGGAGFATTLGVLLATYPLACLYFIVPFLAMLLTIGRRYGVALASVPLLLPFLIILWLMGEPPVLIALPLIVLIPVLFRVYVRRIAAAPPGADTSGG